MKKKSLEKLVNFVNYSLKVDANSTSTYVVFQPQAPKAINQFKKSK